MDVDSSEVLFARCIELHEAGRVVRIYNNIGKSGQPLDRGLSAGTVSMRLSASTRKVTPEPLLWS